MSFRTGCTPPSTLEERAFVAAWELVGEPNRACVPMPPAIGGQERARLISAQVLREFFDTAGAELRAIDRTR